MLEIYIIFRPTENVFLIQEEILRIILVKYILKKLMSMICHDEQKMR